MNNNGEVRVKRMKTFSLLAMALLGLLLSGNVAQAQILPTPPPAPSGELLSSSDLDRLLGPIALYPDPLIAQILPAATLPSQIVVADRFVNGGGDPNLIDEQPWDPSVKALARYPSLLKWMDDNLNWTTALGQAFLSQQQDVMDSIQRLRAQAQALGNLQTTPQANVIVEDGAIEILPSNPQMIYVPVYQPDVVFYQRAYGDPFISFGGGYPVGLWLNHDMDWHNHHLIVWGRHLPRPADWWYRRPGVRPPMDVGRVPVWHPRTRPIPPARDLDRGWGWAVHPPQEAWRGVEPGPAQPPPRRDVTPPPRRENPPPPRETPPPRRENPPPVATTPPRRESAAPPVRPPAPGNVRPGQPAPARPATGALIGVQSSRDTHQFSSRGQESRQATSPPVAPPAPHPTSPPSHSPTPPPAHPGGPGTR
jgi:hypothetical protein